MAAISRISSATINKMLISQRRPVYTTQYWAVLLPLLFISSGICEDTVADDISPHMIMRISQLLTPLECQNFYLRVTGPDKDYGEPPQDLSPDSGLRHNIATMEDCTDTLLSWLQSKGDTVYWDRVFSALYRVGRVDIALELAKNLNQDRTLGLKKIVDKLSKTSQKVKSPLIIYEYENQENVRQVRDLTSKRDEDWDLIVERQQLPPYTRPLTEWSWCMVYGLIIGLFAVPLLASLIFLIIFGMNLLDNTDPQV
ncbi:transmembrane and death domain protein 1 isoform X1 [Dendropsophus ebraccatus]|uniref:transmembrane and death domain protein 1 isoform X1 n=1 Tax=Dendropsophus ebraccatus TaxID=150705 RepID=UPI003831120F